MKNLRKSTDNTAEYLNKRALLYSSEKAKGTPEYCQTVKNFYEYLVPKLLEGTSPETPEIKAIVKEFARAPLQRKIQLLQNVLDARGEALSN